MTYDDAMQCKTKAEADQCLEALIAQAMEHPLPYLTYEEARAIQLENIGYQTGYYSRETAVRILNLFQTEHPIFGKYESEPSQDQMLRAGIALAEAKDQGKSNSEALQAAKAQL